MSATTKEKFYRKFRKSESGCWIWTGNQTSTGYGRIHICGFRWRAHRFSYHFHVSPIPAGMLVCHSCDTPLCVNPEHLFLGTHFDNNRDCARKGRRNQNYERYARGEAQGLSKLTEGAVRHIRASSESGAALARKFGVGRTAVRNVRDGKTWKHVQAGPT